MNEKGQCLISPCISIGLLAHELLPYWFDSNETGLRRLKPAIRVVLRYNCVAARRGCSKAEVFVSRGGSK